MSKKLTEISLRDLLPDNLSKDSNVSKIIDTIDPHILEAAGLIQNAEVLSMIEQQSEQVLDLLGWQFHLTSNEGWADDLTQTQKAALIGDAINLHRYKGTPWAIKQALLNIGYLAPEIIEHSQVIREWSGAGGELLDGGYIDGTGDLSSPEDYNFRFVTHHWAEYAIKLNIADIAYSIDRQQEIKNTAREYAPVSRHMIALILAMGLSFGEPITFHAAQRLTLPLKNCKGYQINNYSMLYGCDEIGGDYEPDLLDGFGILDGESSITGAKPTGEPLDDGSVSINTKIRQGVINSGIKAQRVITGTLNGSTGTLDGGMLTGQLLDGSDILNGEGTLYYPTLASIEDTLDGGEPLYNTETVGNIAFTGMLRTKNKTKVIKEMI